MCFDDDRVSLLDEEALETCYGVPHDVLANTDTGYLLFYQSVDSLETDYGADCGT